MWADSKKKDENGQKEEGDSQTAAEVTIHKQIISHNAERNLHKKAQPGSLTCMGPLK